MPATENLIANRRHTVHGPCVSDQMLDCLSPSVAEAIAGSVVQTATVIEVVSRSGGQLSTVYELRCAEPDDTVIVKVYADKWRWKAGQGGPCLPAAGTA